MGVCPIVDGFDYRLEVDLAIVLVLVPDEVVVSVHSEYAAVTRLEPDAVEVPSELFEPRFLGLDSVFEQATRHAVFDVDFRHCNPTVGRAGHNYHVYVRERGFVGETAVSFVYHVS